jgi:hypothetical protein
MGLDSPRDGYTALIRAPGLAAGRGEEPTEGMDGAMRNKFPKSPDAPLPDLAAVALAVQELEAGRVPDGFTDRHAAARSLIDQLCNAPWRPGKNPNQALVLVLLLRRVIAGGGDGEWKDG